MKTGNLNHNTLHVKTAERQRVVVLLSDQGGQKKGMMKSLYQSNSNIRSIMDRGEEIFQGVRGYSLLSMMFKDDESLHLIENAQAAVFLSSSAIYFDLKQRGLDPDYYIGHGVGEYTALYCNGILNFDDAFCLILNRSDLMKTVSNEVNGSMVKVDKNNGETRELIIESCIDDIYIACKNSENQTIVSGQKSDMDRFLNFLELKESSCSILPTSGAFHTLFCDSAAKGLESYIEDLNFIDKDCSCIISNITGEAYPNDINAVKRLLTNQVISPIEFIKSVEGVYKSGKTHFVEIGPGKILINLLKQINIVNYKAFASADPEQGENESYRTLLKHLESIGKIFKQTISVTQPIKNIRAKGKEYSEKTFDAQSMNRFSFYPGNILIPGVAVGLPGTGKKVFASSNFETIIAGTNMIEPLSFREKKKMADKNVIRLLKEPDGNARFVEITSTEDVIQLAGQLGYFDLNDDYGIKYKYDLAMSLAIGAGIEALKDANIPLVLQYRKTSTGGKIPDGYVLPKEMQGSTGIILSSVFSNSETIIDEITKYFCHKFYIKPYEEFEKVYYHLMEIVKNQEVKQQITSWFFKIREKRKEFKSYKFDRNFILNFCPLGAAHFAQLIKAKGPNLNVNGACASTTEAIAVGEDWIRNGRCDRVIIIGGETPTSPAHNQWIGTSFLAFGAGSVKKTVAEAAKPFDENRNGTILGSGAVSIILEKESCVKLRGLNGQAQLMGTHLANSAFHALNIDVSHLANEMKIFLAKIEKMYTLEKDDYTSRLLLMSHETYTPAKGGSADAEVLALKTSFPENYDKVVISNTKGFTGHTLGAGIEDAVLIKSMQKGQAPPIANLTHIPEDFKGLNLNKNPHGDYEYGFHMAAGFGSHLAFVFFKRIYEKSIETNPEYKKWLQQITGSMNPSLTLIDNKLCAMAGNGVE